MEWDAELLIARMQRAYYRYTVVSGRRRGQKRGSTEGGLGFFLQGRRTFCLRNEKEDKTRKITKKSKTRAFFRKYVKICIFEKNFRISTHTLAKITRDTRSRRRRVVYKLPHSKVNGFLIFIIFSSSNKEIWRNYSCLFIAVLSCYLLYSHTCTMGGDTIGLIFPLVSPPP